MWEGGKGETSFAAGEERGRGKSLRLFSRLSSVRSPSVLGGGTKSRRRRRRRRRQHRAKTSPSPLSFFICLFCPLHPVFFAPSNPPSPRFPAPFVVREKRGEKRFGQVIKSSLSSPRRKKETESVLYKEDKGSRRASSPLLEFQTLFLNICFVFLFR